MLLDVANDRAFQRYLDVMEQRLHVRLAPILIAGIRLQANRNHARAIDYINTRGRPVLALFYRHIYRDQYRAITAQVEEKQLTRFMTEQVAWLTINAGAKINGISTTMADMVAGLIIDMVRQGKSTKRIAAELAKRAPELGKKRSMVIARTETHNAAMAGVEAALKYKNIKVGSKTWVAINDNRTRPSHVAVGGTTVPFDEPFSVGGAQMMRPGDASLGAGAEEIVNCRCSILYHSEGRTPSVEPEAPPDVVPVGDLDTRRQAAASEAERYVRDQGRATGVEHLRWVDYAAGLLSADANRGTKGEVNFTSALLAAIEDPIRRIEVHHNHPSDGSFSGQDLNVLARFPGLYRLWAHGSQGGRFLATDAKHGAGDVIDWLGRYKSVNERWLESLDWKMQYRVRSHAVSLATEKVGLFKYSAELAPDVAQTIDRHQSSFEAMVETMHRRGTLRAKSRHYVKAISDTTPALIDPPPMNAPVEEWIEYREGLLQSDTPGLGPFIREADRVIARLRHSAPGRI
jgi:SPP1 gp7 family putative phage head morphogenesis protein